MEDASDLKRDLRQTLETNNLRLEWRDPRQLAPHPENPKSHPVSQLEALSDFMEDVGWVGAILYNENTGRIIDGHARHAEALERGDELVPVLVVNLPVERENQVLALMDKIGTMYSVHSARAAALAKITKFRSAQLAALMQDLAPGRPARAKDEDEGNEGGEEDDNVSPDTPAQLREITPLPPGGLSLTIGEQYDYVVLLFHSNIDFIAAHDVFKLKRVQCPFNHSGIGIGRVVDGGRFVHHYSSLLKELKDLRAKLGVEREDDDDDE